MCVECANSWLTLKALTNISIQAKASPVLDCELGLVQSMLHPSVVDVPCNWLHSDGQGTDESSDLYEAFEESLCLPRVPDPMLPLSSETRRALIPFLYSTWILF